VQRAASDWVGAKMPFVRLTEVGRRPVSPRRGRSAAGKRNGTLRCRPGIAPVSVAVPGSAMHHSPALALHRARDIAPIKARAQP
jgi:hypothetical protein